MASEPVDLARHFMRERDRLVRKRDKLLLDSYAEAQLSMADRIEGDMERRQAEYGTVVFDEEAARILDIEQEIAKLSPRITNLIHEGMREQTQLAVEAAEAQVELARRRGGVTGSMGRLNKESVDALADRVVQRRNITSLLDGHTREYRDKVSRALLSQQIQGKNPREAARFIMKETGGESGGTLSRWLTVARTEMMDASRIGLSHTYQQHSDFIRAKERLATLDERTCMACVVLDGTEYPLDAPEDGHQNCRCSWIPVLKRRRRDRDGDEKRETGVKWFKKQPESVQKKMMGQQMWSAWDRKIVNFDDMVIERSNFGWRPAKYQASYKDALSLWDRTPMGRGMAQLKRLPVVGRAIPVLFSPADEILLLAWKGRNFQQALSGVRRSLLGPVWKQMSQPAWMGLPPMVRQMIQRQIRTSTEHFLFSLYRGGFPRMLVPTRGPVRNVDTWMHKRLDWVAGTLDKRITNIILKGVPMEGDLPKPGSQQEILEMLFNRLAGYQPITAQRLALPAGRIQYIEEIPEIVDEFTPWGSMANELRDANTVAMGGPFSPGGASIFDIGASGGITFGTDYVGPNELLIRRTWEMSVPGRVVGARVRVGTALPNGGMFFSRVVTMSSNEATGAVYWTDRMDVADVSIPDLVAMFEATTEAEPLPFGFVPAGRWVRSFYGSDAMHHASFSMNEGFQDLGFAEAFYQRSIAYYITHRVTKVTISTATIGSYTWANNWLFQFTAGSTALTIIENQRSKIRDMIDAGHITEADVSLWLNQVVAREERGDPMRSHELARLGIEKQWEEIDRGGPHRMHFGKNIMIGSGWSGTLSLEQPTETSRFGVPWPIPVRFLPKYPRLLDVSNVGDFNINIEELLRAWVTSVLVEEIPKYEILRIELPAQPQAIIVEAPIGASRLLDFLQTEVTTVLQNTRNILINSPTPAGIPLLNAVRQAMIMQNTFPEIEKLDQWIEQLENGLPDIIRRPGSPPAPPVLSGGPRTPPTPPAPAGVAGEPWRPLPPPPALNPWHRTLTTVERGRVLDAVREAVGYYTPLDSDELTRFFDEGAAAVLEEVFTGRFMYQALLDLKPYLAEQFNTVAAEGIVADVRSFMTGYLSTTAHEWNSLDLWDTDQDRMIMRVRISGLLRMYGVPVTEEMMDEVTRWSGAYGLADHVRQVIGGTADAMVVQTVYDMLQYMGGEVPDSSRRLQLQPITSAPPDYTAFNLRWGMLAQEEARPQLVDQLTWALTDNLPGGADTRRQRAEQISEEIVDDIMGALLDGNSPMSAMRQSWREYLLRGGTTSPSEEQGLYNSFSRVAGSELFDPAPIEVTDATRNALYDNLRPIFGTYTQEITNRIAENIDRPLQIAIEETQRFVEQDPNPQPFPIVLQDAINAVQSAVGARAAVIDSALMRRFRQIAGDVSIRLGYAPATRVMEGAFTRELARGNGITTAIDNAIRAVIPDVDGWMVQEAVQDYRRQPLAAPMPVLDLNDTRVHRTLRSIMGNIEPLVVEEGLLNLAVSNLPIDEAVAVLNVDTIETEALITYIRRIREHYGQSDLVEQQAAVEPIRPSTLIDREYNPDQARQIYFRYYADQAPRNLTVEEDEAFFRNIWAEYVNGAIPRYPIDVDVRLRRALDIADVPGYDTLRQDLTTNGAAPVDEQIIRTFRSGWDPATVDHLLWLVRSDPVLRQHERPAPVQYDRWTYPNRSARPPYTRTVAEDIYRAYHGEMDELYDSGEGDEFIEESLFAAFDSFYGGFTRILPSEITGDIAQAFERTGIGGQRFELMDRIIRSYSGRDNSLTEAIEEVLEEEWLDRDLALIFEQSLRESRRYQRFLIQDARPQPLFAPGPGSHRGEIFDAAIHATPVLERTSNDRQRAQMDRILRGLINRRGIPEMTVANLMNDLRMAHAMIDAWVSEETLGVWADQMYQAIREAQPPPAPPSPTATAFADRFVFRADNVLEPGVYMIDPAEQGRITELWDNIVPALHVDMAGEALSEIRFEIPHPPVDYTSGLLNQVMDEVSETLAGMFQDMEDPEHDFERMMESVLWDRVLVRRVEELPLRQQARSINYPGMYRISEPEARRIVESITASEHGLSDAGISHLEGILEAMRFGWNNVTFPHDASEELPEMLRATFQSSESLTPELVDDIDWWGTLELEIVDRWEFEPPPQPLVHIIPFGPWQDLRHAILNLFMEEVNDYGHQVSGTWASQDEMREYHNVINNTLPDTIPEGQAPTNWIEAIGREFEGLTNLEATDAFLHAIYNLPEWHRYPWPGMPAIEPGYIRVHILTAESWEHDMHPPPLMRDMFDHLMHEAGWFVEVQTIDTTHGVYDVRMTSTAAQVWVESGPDDMLYETERAVYRVRPFGDYQPVGSTTMPPEPVGVVTAAYDVIQSAEVEELLRYPIRPSDPYKGIVPEAFQEEATALRNMYEWRRLEVNDPSYREPQDVMRRFIAARQAGANQLQAIADISEDLSPGLHSQPADEQRRRVADLHQTFMSQLMGGNRYGGTQPADRTIETVMEELQQMGAAQRPLGPDPEEIRLLREMVIERLSAGLPPMETDINELAELLHQSPYQTLGEIIADMPHAVDPLAIRQHIIRRMAAGFHIDAEHVYIKWLAKILGENPGELLSHIMQEVQDNQERPPGPGTVGMPVDPLMTDINVPFRMSLADYWERLELVPGGQGIQREWNAAETANIEEALRQIFLEPFAESDERWDVHRASLRGHTPRELRDLTRFTQEQLRAAGITHIKLYRGEGAYTENLGEWARERFNDVGDGRFQLTGRAASSWSIYPGVADEFALYSDGDYDVIYEAVVPIEQVAFMFPPFHDETRAHDWERGDPLPYPTFGEFVIVGDVYAEVTITDNETEELVEPTALPLDRNAITTIDYIAALLRVDVDNPKEQVRALFEAVGRKFNTRFWHMVQSLPLRAPMRVDSAVFQFVKTLFKQQFGWIPSISKTVQVALLDVVHRDLLARGGDPWAFFRLFERWKQLVQAGVEPKQAWEDAGRVARVSFLSDQAGIWEAFEWERAALHTPLMGGDIIVNWGESGLIASVAKVAYDEVIDEVTGWRSTNLIYLHDPMRAITTRIDQIGEVTRPGVRWVALTGSENVAFKEQARRAALAGIRPGERVFLVKTEGMRAWNAIYAPEHIAPDIREYLDRNGAEQVSLVEPDLPATPRIGSNILLDDQNAYRSFLDDRDSYVVRLLNQFPNQDEANRVAELYHMWKGGADTYRVQVLYSGTWPSREEAVAGGLGAAVPSQEEIDRDQDLLQRMIRFGQEDLRRRGITYVRLFRGLTAAEAAIIEAEFSEDDVGEEVALTSRTITSWSVYGQISLNFALGESGGEGGPAIVMTTVVPVEKIAFVFPPFPQQPPNAAQVMDLVEGEFAVLGNIVAEIHHWTVVGPNEMEIWNDFLIDILPELIVAQPTWENELRSITVLAQEQWQSMWPDVDFASALDEVSARGFEYGDLSEHWTDAWNLVNQTWLRYWEEAQNEED